MAYGSHHIASKLAADAASDPIITTPRPWCWMRRGAIHPPKGLGNNKVSIVIVLPGGCRPQPRPNSDLGGHTPLGRSSGDQREIRSN